MILLALAAQASAVEAERAFAADAQAIGQWSAFRKWAATDAILFVPEPAKAKDFLKDRADPPQSVRWRPAVAFVSCDGSAAVTTGPAEWPGGAHSSFTTVWTETADGWRWRLDHGRETPGPSDPPGETRIVRPDCSPAPASRDADYAARLFALTERGAAGKWDDARWYRERIALDGFAADVRVQRDDTQPATGAPKRLPRYAAPGPIRDGVSSDGTLRWRSNSITGKPGAHDLVVTQWQGAGNGWRIVLYDIVGVAE